MLLKERTVTTFSSDCALKMNSEGNKVSHCIGPSNLISEPQSKTLVACELKLRCIIPN